MKARLLTVGDIVRVYFAGRISADTIRRAERHGELRAIRTLGGVRLFDPADVEVWVRQRDAVSGDAA